MSAEKFRVTPDHARRSLRFSREAFVRIAKISEKHATTHTQVFLRLGWRNPQAAHHVLIIDSSLKLDTKNGYKYVKASAACIEKTVLTAVPCICDMCVTSIEGWLANEPQWKNTRQLVSGVKWAVPEALFAETVAYRERLMLMANVARGNGIALNANAYEEVSKLLK